MRFEFHPEALTEYLESTRYYGECQEGLELRFIDAIEHAVERICKRPQQYRIIEEDVRRCLTRVFPFAVLYTIEPEFILIIAVMHCHREPGYWRQRIKSGR